MSRTGPGLSPKTERLKSGAKRDTGAVMNEIISDWRKMGLEQELALEINNEDLEYAENI